MMNKEIDDTKCPLCGNMNRCQMANGSRGDGCWCQGKTVSSELMATVADNALNRACICQQCIDRAKKLVIEV